MGLKQPPPLFSASTVEQICRILGEAVIGSQIPNLIAPLLVSESSVEAQGTKWKRLFNAVATAQNRQKDGRPFIRLISEVMAPVRFPSPAAFEQCRSLVNERLLLAGFSVAVDGKLEKVAPAASLADAQHRADDLRPELVRREVHQEVLRFCRAELLERNYFHAVLEACKSLSERLRGLTGLQEGMAAQLVERHMFAVLWASRRVQQPCHGVGTIGTDGPCHDHEGSAQRVQKSDSACTQDRVGDIQGGCA
jgi:hypothetical protein